MDNFNNYSPEDHTIPFHTNVPEPPADSFPEPEPEVPQKKKGTPGIVRFWNNLVGMKASRKPKAFFYSFFASTLAALLLGTFLLYGPISFFKDTLITSAMTTYSHKYFAEWFFSEETIKAVMAKNSVTAPKGSTDTSQVSAKTKMKASDIKITDVSRNGFKGWMMEIPDPSWVRLAVPQNFGKHGAKLPIIMTDYGAIAGINAGGFADANGFGNGGTPVGMVIVDHEIIYNSTGSHHNIIGFNDDNVLVLGKYTTSEIKTMNLRDAVEFTPALIINGEPAEMYGNGGWGYAPRTAIGQRQDGTVLFLVIDGRSISSAGATMRDVLNIMLEYKAYNATNLDGGSSSVLIHNDVVLNHPSGSDSDGQRFLPNAWIVVDPSTYKAPTDRPPHNK